MLQHFGTAADAVDLIALGGERPLETEHDGGIILDDQDSLNGCTSTACEGIAIPSVAAISSGTGSVNVKVDPSPRLLSTVIRPPCASMM